MQIYNPKCYNILQYVVTYCYYVNHILLTYYNMLTICYQYVKDDVYIFVTCYKMLTICYQYVNNMLTIC